MGAAEKIRSMTRNTSEPYWVAIVDDDKAVCQALGNLLESVGLRVEAFASAEDFIGSNQPRKRSCLILDVQLPRMSGLDLQSRLSEEEDSIPIIFISAHEDAEVKDRAIRDGAVGFFYKPFSTEALLGAVLSTLR